MGSVEGWIAIGALALGTFAIRFSFLGLLAGRRVPAGFERTMRLAVLALFAALVVPLVVMHDERFAPLERVPHIAAALATAAVAWWRGGTLSPLLAGMATLHLLLQAKALIN
ncbi:MAG: AzlD domain-containing protein [Casimicrobiaceae bacterium]|nr:AzlD domain-containing protein [Casimicrobiaceae bacterium]MCX8098830.1 AzlD domain-containing protein [Casimicrobiaceae bacterium]MDW8311517.1 AzlD domain-containing protein [Burkholderiales bacterium]